MPFPKLQSYILIIYSELVSQSNISIIFVNNSTTDINKKST